MAYTAGAAIGPDLFRFYRSIGINLKQLYGQTETCAYVCLQPDGQIKLDSVGTPAPECRGQDGRQRRGFLVRGPMLLKAILQAPGRHRRIHHAEGYFATGDAGFFDADGHLKIIDRAKDVGKLTGGGMFAPNRIENKLKFFQHIKESCASATAVISSPPFINIDLEAVGNWAERKGMAYGYTDLAQPAEVYGGLIRECVEQVNADLAADPNMADSQIRRFPWCCKELDADDDELTRTRKVRRNFIAEKYAVLIDAPTAARPASFIETQVTFEDGRTNKVSAEPAHRRRESFPPARPSGLNRRHDHDQTDWRRDRRPPEHQPALWRREGADRHLVQRARARIRSIIGPNGAGKSSMLNVINGVHHPRKEGRSSSRARLRCAEDGAPWRRSRASPAPSRTSRCSRA